MTTKTIVLIKPILFEFNYAFEWSKFFEIFKTWNVFVQCLQKKPIKRHDSKDLIKILFLVHGGWSAWSPIGFTECSVTCGEGTQSRNRSCTSPEPAHNGFPCIGNDYEVQECVNPECNGKFN